MLTFTAAAGPDISFERHAPTATSTAPSNALMQFVGPLPNRSNPRFSVSLPGQTAGTATVSIIQDSSLGGLNDIAQVQLPPAPPGTPIVVRSLSGFPGATEWTVRRSADADTTPPTMTGELVLGYEYVPATPNSTCVSSQHFEVFFTFPTATDDFGVANYTLYETTGGTRVTLSSIYPGRGSFGGNNVGFVPIAPVGERCFAVVARDLAGNESAPLSGCITPQVPVTPDAGQVEVDAGTPLAVDAGTPVDAGPVDAIDIEAESCRCVSARADLRIPGLLALALLPLALRRRR